MEGHLRRVVAKPHMRVYRTLTECFREYQILEIDYSGRQPDTSSYKQLEPPEIWRKRAKLCTVSGLLGEIPTRTDLARDLDTRLWD